MAIARSQTPLIHRDSRGSGRCCGDFAALLRATILPLSLLCAASASAAEFIPHRAHYKFTMMSSRNGAGIANVDGEMVADWDQSCEGWTLSQKSVMNIYVASGRRLLSIASTISTWESRDGREYRFSVRNTRDGKTSEVIEGMARMAAEGLPGWSEFTAPKAKKLTLPRGTLFPTNHTLLVLRKLDQAPTIVSVPVFDGMTVDGVHDVTAVIGLPVRGGSAQAKLAGRRSWPVQLAFFRIEGRQAEPEHEIGMRLFDNGVSEALVLDFGNFKVRGILARLELGRRPVCN